LDRRIAEISYLIAIAGKRKKRANAPVKMLSAHCSFCEKMKEALKLIETEYVILIVVNNGT